MVVVINILAVVLIKALTRQKRRAEEVIEEPDAPVIGASGGVI
jgi:hypothetical protein